MAEDERQQAAPRPALHSACWAQQGACVGQSKGRDTASLWGFGWLRGWGTQGRNEAFWEPTFWWVRRIVSQTLRQAHVAEEGPCLVARAPSASPWTTHRSIDQPHLGVGGLLCQDSSLSCEGCLEFAVTFRYMYRALKIMIIIIYVFLPTIKTYATKRKNTVWEEKRSIIRCIYFRWSPDEYIGLEKLESSWPLGLCTRSCFASARSPCT